MGVRPGTALSAPLLFSEPDSDSRTTGKQEKANSPNPNREQGIFFSSFTACGCRRSFVRSELGADSVPSEPNEVVSATGQSRHWI